MEPTLYEETDNVMLQCSECLKDIGEVDSITWGHIGTCSLCDACDEIALAEILDGEGEDEEDEPERGLTYRRLIEAQKRLGRRE